MGLDAKGRNFSAPRLTPGKSSEVLVYGSPKMLNDQARQIAVMEARVKRYGYGGMRSINSASLGSSSSISNSLSMVPFGTSLGSNAASYTARPITPASNPNNRSTLMNSARGYNAARSKSDSKASTLLIVIFILMFVGPVVISIIESVIGLIERSIELL